MPDPSLDALREAWCNDSAALIVAEQATETQLSEDEYDNLRAAVIHACRSGNALEVEVELLRAREAKVRERCEVKITSNEIRSYIAHAMAAANTAGINAERAAILAILDEADDG